MRNFGKQNTESQSGNVGGRSDINSIRNGFKFGNLKAELLVIENSLCFICNILLTKNSINAQVTKLKNGKRGFNDDDTAARRSSDFARFANK